MMTPLMVKATMKHVLFLFFVSLSGVVASAQEDSSNAKSLQNVENRLPKEWLGIWVGEMVITNPRNEKTSVPVKLEIASLRDSENLTWVTTYGDKETDSKVPNVVKEYELVPGKEKPGQFMIDEKNGIMLPSRLVENVLYSQFVVGESSITARYELVADQIQFEIISTKQISVEEKSMVKPFNINVIQRVKLKRKK